MSDSAEMPQPCVVKLFVTGQSARSMRAIRNLELIREMVRADLRVTVIDVLEQVELADAERIVATPIVIKEHPPPQRRLIGDLGDHRQVIDGLGLTEHIIQGAP